MKLLVSEYRGTINDAGYLGGNIGVPGPSMIMDSTCDTAGNPQYAPL